MQIQCSSPIQILYSLISLSLSSSGFADASVAPIDFPIAPAAAVPKVLYFNQIFWTACQGGRVVSRLDLQSGTGAVLDSSPTLATSRFVLSNPELKTSATLVNGQFVTSCKLGL